VVVFGLERSENHLKKKPQFGFYFFKEEKTSAIGKQTSYLTPPNLQQLYNTSQALFSSSIYGT
tara:strand:- start:171 stop:359 length:189 start_codon:yes stop_codon:yes gene_type:complete